MKPEKLLIKVMIEGDHIYPEDYVEKQKIQVIVNKSIDNLGISSEGRELRREDGTPIPPEEWKKTIEELGIYAGECLRFIKKAPKPDRDKGFA